MYNPEHFAERDLDVLHRLIEAHPLGTWVTEVAGQLVVNHVPFVLDSRGGQFGTLAGHVARPNDVWKTTSDVESVVVFHGAEAYITPSWYPTKREHGKVVPTWNYVVVHAHGVPRVITDREWLHRQVSALTLKHEAARPAPWQVSDAPASYIEAMLAGIVGIEIPITRIVGKWKVSQNRSEQDRLGVFVGLSESPDPKAQQVAQLVRGQAASEG